MNVGRFFSWTILAGMAIAGGLFVSDQRVMPSSRIDAPLMPTGIPLRLGVVLSDTPATQGMNQAITHTLLLARDQVNQCGGINQTPVFLAIEPAAPKATPSGQTTSADPQASSHFKEAIAQEALAMNRLIQSQDIHGAIAALTIEPTSPGLISEALDTAIDFNIPIVSPSNTQPLVVGADNSPFDRFRQELTKVDTRKQGNRSPNSPTPFQLQTKKTKYWSRTIMSDRQHLMMVAQLAHQQGWNQIATLGPDSDRGDYLEQLLSETLAAWNKPTILPEQSLHYSIALTKADATPSDITPSDIKPSDATPSEATSSEATSSEAQALDAFLNVPPDSPSSNPQETTPTTLKVDIEAEILTTNPPDAVIVFLEPSMFSELSSPSASPISIAQEDASNGSTPSQKNASPSAHTSSNPPNSNATLAPVSGSLPQTTLLGQQDLLPPIATALMDQLQTVVDLEQTPVILGNWLDIELLLAQMSDINEDGEPSPHPMAGLRGILSRPALSLYHVLPNIKQSVKSLPPLHLKSTIAHSTWDAAVLMMLAAEAAGYNHKDAIQNNLRNVANPPGTEVTDVCEALELIRQGQAINYQGISGRVDLNGWGNVNPPQTYRVWEITPTGNPQTVKTLEWLEPSSATAP